MTKRRRWFRWFAVAAIVLLSGSAVIFTRAVDVSSQKLARVTFYDWAWSAVQGRIEAAELENRILRFALSNDQASLEAAVLFQQILLSRTRTWGAGDFAIFLGEEPRMLARYNSIVSDVNSLGDILRSPPDRDAMAKAIAQAGALKDSVDRLGIGAHSHSVVEMAKVRDELRNKQTTLKVLIAFLFLVGLALILLIWRQNLSLALANATNSESARRHAKSEARLLGVLETTTDGVLVLDRDFRVNFANNNAISMMFPDRPYLGIPLWLVVGSSPTSEVYANYRKSLEQQVPLSFESYFAPMGMWLEDHVFPSPDTLTVFFRDVTERRSRREELVRLSQHDPLTGLANRSLFDERLALGLQCGRRPSGLILVMIDFDDFKAINDNLGHMAGDRLVQQFAQRLSSLMRLGDTVARYGGDEFAIIQPGPVEPNAGAEVARRIAEALLTPFDLGGSEVKLAVSIGIAMAPQHGVRPDELVRRADLAMYRAKEGKGTGVNYRVFEPAMEDARQAPRRGPPPCPPTSSEAGSQSRRSSRPTSSRLAPS